MLKTYGFHSFIQRPHFSQNAKNLFRASFSTPSDIAAYIYSQSLHLVLFNKEYQVLFLFMIFVVKKHFSLIPN